MIYLLIGSLLAVALHLGYALYIPPPCLLCGRRAWYCAGCAAKVIDRLRNATNFGSDR